MNSVYPGLSVQIEGAFELCKGNGWDYHVTTYTRQAGFVVKDLYSSIASNYGPVILGRPVSGRDSALLQSKIENSVPFYCQDLPWEIQELSDLFLQIFQAFEQGEPLLPRRFVVALLVLGKLVRNENWGGKNKNYLWAADIAKGRGVDEQYADETGTVLAELERFGYVKSKLSQGKKKWAANPTNVEKIMKALDELRFEEKLNSILMRDNRLESTRALDSLRKQTTRIRS